MPEENASQETPVVESAPSYDWRNDIHPDVKDEKVWENVPDIKTLTKAYADASRYNVGALKLPAEDAPAEEWNKVWDKLGRPQNPDDYQNTHEEPDHDPEFASKLKRVCHEAGLAKMQWQKLATGYNQVLAEQAQQEEQKVQEAIRVLRDEYGSAFEKNVSLLERYVRKLGGEDAWNEIKNDGLGRRPHFVRLMIEAAKAGVEQKLISPVVEGYASTSDAKAKVDELVNSPAYLDRNHPDHNRVVDLVTKLFEQIYG